MHSKNNSLFLAFALSASVLFTAGEASAQFANHSIGFELGYVGVPSAKQIGGGVDFGLNSTLYIEGGFDLYFRLLAGIHRDNLADKNVFGVFPALGFRYLFSEDPFRPYIGLNIAYMHFFTDEYKARFSLSPMVGFDFFATDDFSIGLQAEYHPILSLNDPVEHGIGVLSKVGWSF